MIGKPRMALEGSMNMRIAQLDRMFLAPQLVTDINVNKAAKEDSMRKAYLQEVDPLKAQMKETIVVTQQVQIQRSEIAKLRQDYENCRQHCALLESEHEDQLKQFRSERAKLQEQLRAMQRLDEERNEELIHNRKETSRLHAMVGSLQEKAAKLESKCLETASRSHSLEMELRAQVATLMEARLKLEDEVHTLKLEQETWSMKTANFNKEVKRVAMLEAKLPKSLERLVQRMDELKLDFNLTFSELIENVTGEFKLIVTSLARLKKVHKLLSVSLQRKVHIFRNMAMEADKRCLLEKECARLRGELSKESEICHKALETAAALERELHDKQLESTDQLQHMISSQKNKSLQDKDSSQKLIDELRSSMSTYVESQHLALKAQARAERERDQLADLVRDLSHKGSLAAERLRESSEQLQALQADVEKLKQEVSQRDMALKTLALRLEASQELQIRVQTRGNDKLCQTDPFLALEAENSILSTSDRIASLMQEVEDARRCERKLKEQVSSLEHDGRVADSMIELLSVQVAKFRQERE
ncbi:hypothetical protein GUITHDRAFT_106129 [Guillardia theta CCMP2712]|uniref:Uncharacterized protein n=1 Tax=Guillardia theta (strain CCMP2712) TaxID=905079 RepID=L1JHP8_GUITC|nr:hypothetical protein GUITHDRAFT_106129 [Guillardia theta CCMP2712]EKX48048.1 hypothetical protein GUITHDRAFT_106129 [Guillardia theta CCMP2712]|eukprot:XP_005835028.1 hypothetical protein GUITHDRAFT_106129 [Guillardia theta CCMP2712]